VVERVHAGIRATDDDRFITLFCARFDAARRTVEYVNAGHPDGLLRTAGGQVHALPPTGPLVSPAFPAARWRVESRAFARGDQLVLHTDGIEEAAGPHELFGRERLLAVLRRGLVGAELLDAVLAAVEAFREGRPVQDDRSLLVARLR
jgi:sigma-B regulation protein RsbU (phosphoserine phosphatase)